MGMWVIRNDVFDAELLEQGFVSMGWDDVGDIGLLGDDPVVIRGAVERCHPGARPRAYALWAGILRRFVFEMAPGDVVIAPSSTTSTLSFGVVEGPYDFVDESTHRHRRRVRWVKTGVARSLFPQAALREIGSIMTLFRVRRNADLFRRYLEAPSDEAFTESLAAQSFETSPVDPVAAPESSDDALDAAAVDAAPTAVETELATQDAIVEALLGVSPEQFEQLTADLLRAMGYQARTTQYVADGGVDVIAHRDPLGLEPPIIKVQCKRMSSAQGGPQVQQLLGTLAPGELGLFVTLGTYTTQAFAIERSRRDLRLLGGADVARLVLEHYPTLPQRWRDLVPLRQVWVLDRHLSL